MYQFRLTRQIIHTDFWSNFGVYSLYIFVRSKSFETVNRPKGIFYWYFNPVISCSVECEYFGGTELSFPICPMRILYYNPIIEIDTMTKELLMVL